MTMTFYLISVPKSSAVQKPITTSYSSLDIVELVGYSVISLSSPPGYTVHGDTYFMVSTAST